MKRLMCFFIRLVLLIVLLVLIGAGGFYYFVPGLHLKVSDQIGLQKENAVWMAHEWVGEAHSREEIHSVLSTLINNHISLVFLHSGPIDSDGNVPHTRYIYARNFLKTAHEIAPEITFHAWIGQIRNELLLEDPQTIVNIIESAVYLVEEVGFDGIHLNIEPMQGDPVFEVILQGLNEGLSVITTKRGEKAELSAAVSPIVPTLPLELMKLRYGDSFFGHDLNKAYSSLEYTKGLAEYVDYLALMGYDTGFKDKKLYKWFMEQEMIFLTNAAPGKALMGIPSYEDERPNFDPSTENVGTALEGVHMGLSNIRSDADDLAGLAIYARWTTDDSEWSTWQEKWLNNGKND